MQELEKRLEILNQNLAAAWDKLGIDEKIARIETLEKEVAEPEIWQNPANATAKNQELAKLTDEINPWKLLHTQTSDIKELITLSDDGLKSEIEEQVAALEKTYEELKKALRFNGPHDDKNAILRIT
ncbi:PCRF domain-containing protein, partial [Ralstonia pseudosolanacearum]|uniref:PCRF domain-containing protein n=1 Tax=Ralstonia pseudosolanacearum TaxID=1310165 RepID=UPI003D1839EA